MSHSVRPRNPMAERTNERNGRPVIAWASCAIAIALICAPVVGLSETTVDSISEPNARTQLYRVIRVPLFIGAALVVLSGIFWVLGKLRGKRRTPANRDQNGQR